MKTFNAGVGGLEVGGEVFRAWLHAVDGRIWNDELAGTTTGAASVEDVTNISSTAKMTVTARYAASELHSTVTCLINQHYLTSSTRRVERLHVTEFRRH